ncbi:MAG TPA: hypothetical protein VHT72_00615, partial [Puia sp.]|nr:hypothetical protein [Puia sp.]
QRRGGDGHGRDEQEREGVLDAPETIATDDDLEMYDQRTQDFEVMEQALQHLGEPCKELLESYYIRKKNMSEIAKEFGYTNADNAKNQKYKCLMRLKKIFFGHYNHNTNLK